LKKPTRSIDRRDPRAGGDLIGSTAPMEVVE
jgi:hypothetical protein